VIAGIAAVQSVPQGLTRVATAFGATRLQIYTRIYFPAMIPIIIGGMRLGLIFTIFGVLLSEMYAASHGVGQTLFSWGEQTRLAELLAGVLLVVAITVTLDELMRFGERRSRRRRVEA
jgi:NitT/TauT family transport system permease protein